MIILSVVEAKALELTIRLRSKRNQQELMPSSIPSLLELLRNGIICQTTCSDTTSTTLMQTGSNQALKSG
jgi:hypothetical protein